MSKKILFLREVMEEIVFSSLIAFNVMLTSHCDNVNKSLLCYIPSLFRHAISSQLDHATIYLRCCHIVREKAQAVEMPLCTKEIGKEITSKSLWEGLGWQEKGISANVVRDPRRQLNPAAVVANLVALVVSTDQLVPLFANVGMTYS